MKHFAQDLVKTLFYFAFSGVYYVLEIVASLIGMFVRLFKYFVIPQVTELLADVNLFIKIFMQSVYSLLSHVSLLLSKSFYVMSRYYHEQSEKLVNETWEYR